MKGIAPHVLHDATHTAHCPSVNVPYDLWRSLVSCRVRLTRPHQLATEFSDFQGFFSRKSLI